MYAIIWGLFVVSPFTDVFAKNPSIYRPMLTIIPYEIVWGALILVTGIVAELFTRWGQISKACFTISVVFFSFAVLYMKSDYGSPAWGLWGWLAVYNFLIAWERRGEWKIFQKA
jgi:hypothetical protein